MKKGFISVLLVIVLMAGMLPMSAFADDFSADEAVLYSIEEVLSDIMNESDSVVTQSAEYGSFIDGKHVIGDMVNRINNDEMDAHPRLIMTEDRFISLRSHIDDGTTTATLLKVLRSVAEEECKKDVEKYEIVSEYSLLEVSKRIQRRVAALALAYNIFGDEKYAKRAYLELENACKFKDWNSYHFLDTAEMCTAFAFGYDWLYDWMSEEQRAYLRKNMIEKGLNQVMEDYTDASNRKRTYKWYQATKSENWQFVCTGGTNLAALAIGDESDAQEIAATVIDYGYKRAYTCLRDAYSTTDGTYIEGLGYWDYATYYIGLQSSALTSATGSDYGLADRERLEKSAEFVHYMSSNVPLSFSFGDDRDSRNTGWAVFLWLGELLDSPKYTEVRLKNIRTTGRDEDGFNYLDLLWIDESKESGVETTDSTDWVSVGASNASFRTSWDYSGLVAALHSGENNYKIHGHYDLGSFYIEADGQRFFTDLGNEDYNLENRKVSYRIKAEGHNTLVINPTKDIDQREDAVCSVVECSTGNVAYAITDLTDAYSTSDAKSVKRGLKMIKDKECVIIQDEISLNKAGEIYWFAHTKGEISIAADGRSAIVTVTEKKKENGKEIEVEHYLWVGLLSQGGVFTSMKAEPLPTSEAVPGAKDNKEYRKLVINLTNTKDATITVACIPLKEGASSPSWIPTVKSLSEWSTSEEENGTEVSPSTPSSTSKAEIKYQNISLSDTIAMNLYAEISEDIAKTTGANMTFTLKGRDIIVPISEAEKITSDGKVLYKFTCPVPAKDMSYVMKAVIKAGNYTSEPYWCSIKDYADYIFDNPEDFEGYVSLVEAMVNYGAAAQKYFCEYTELLANEALSDRDKELTVLKADMLKSYEFMVTGSNEAYEFMGISLVLRDRVALKLMFNTSTGIITETIPINAGELGVGKSYTFHGITFTNFSAYSYLYYALEENMYDLTEIAGALYDYNEAASELKK